MKRANWILFFFLVAAMPAFTQQTPNSDELSLSAPQSGEQAVSWFSAEQFREQLRLSQKDPLPLEALSLANIGMARPRFSIKSLFVATHLPLMNEEKGEGSFGLPGGNVLRYGYNLDATTPFRLVDSNIFSRESIDRMPRANFNSIADRMYGGDDSWSAYYGGNFNLPAGFTLDLGAHYEERRQMASVGDVEILSPRYALTYAITDGVRIELAGGKFDNYTIYNLDDNLDLNGLGNTAAPTLGDFFHSDLTERKSLAVEFDLTKQSTLRLEGFGGGVDDGMNLWLRHRR